MTETALEFLLLSLPCVSAGSLGCFAHKVLTFSKHTAPNEPARLTPYSLSSVHTAHGTMNLSSPIFCSSSLKPFSCVAPRRHAVPPTSLLDSSISAAWLFPAGQDVCVGGRPVRYINPAICSIQPDMHLIQPDEEMRSIAVGCGPPRLHFKWRRCAGAAPHYRQAERGRDREGEREGGGESRSRRTQLMLHHGAAFRHLGPSFFP
ncbi:hypothetical protein Q8A73_008541 [Channa argus]|nr:hypothetical protein Q8A73_008541 [Channa argus]